MKATDLDSLELIAAELACVRARWPGRGIPADVGWSFVVVVRRLRGIAKGTRVGLRRRGARRELMNRLSRVERDWTESVQVPF